MQRFGVPLPARTIRVLIHGHPDFKDQEHHIALSHRKQHDKLCVACQTDETFTTTNQQRWQPMGDQ
jgi:hypothetical protein